MHLKEKEIKNFIINIIDCIKAISHPIKLYKKIIRNDLINTISSSIFYIIIITTLFSIIMKSIEIKNHTSTNNLAFLLLSITYIPLFIGVFIRRKISVKQKIKTSIFFPIFIIPTLILPILVFFNIFLTFENYFFYYLGIFSLILINITLLIVYPLIFNRGKKRLQSLVFTILIFSSVNSLYTHFSRIQTGDLDLIYKEFTDKEIFKKSNTQYIYRSLNAILLAGDNNITNYDPEILQELDAISNALDYREKEFLEFKNELKFERNKFYIDHTVKLIHIARKITLEIYKYKKLYMHPQEELDLVIIKIKELEKEINENKGLLIENKLLLDEIKNIINIDLPEDEYKKYKEKLAIINHNNQKLQNSDKLLKKEFTIMNNRQIELNESIKKLNYNITINQEINYLFDDFKVLSKEFNEHTKKQIRIIELKNSIGF